MAARSVFSSGTALALALDLVEEGSTDALEQLPGPRKAAWFNAPNGNTPAVQEQHAASTANSP
jgi:hypothetical protein